MSPSIVSLGEKGFNEFSILLHETIERYSSEGKEPKELSFYIPPDSLEILYNKEKKSSSDLKDPGNKIEIVAGFYRESKLLQRVPSRFEIFSQEKKMKRMLIRIYNLGNHDFRGVGLPKYFDEELSDNILGLIVDLNEKDKIYDRNLSYFLKEYFRKHQREENQLFLILRLTDEKGKKIIQNIYSEKDSKKDLLRNKIGKKLMKNDFTKTWKVIDNKKREITNLEFFYTSYLKIKKLHPKIKGFEPVNFRSHILLYPYNMYVDMLFWIKENYPGTFSHQQIMEETMK